MEIIGKLIKILPEQSGQSERGTWVRGGFVIETDEQFPKQVSFTLFGEERVRSIKSIAINSQIRVSFSPESREFNERWYTDLRCFKIETFNPVMSNDFVQTNNPYPQSPASYPVNNAAAPQNNFVAPAPAPTYEEGNFNQQATEDDDLPF
ncbi:MAG: DUF3127 domain-containing protein [Bacteroidales bacterium]|jgi:hypothetical protein|nr:DUF3127 domain-containing protein [Bacteroidales bacterium]